MESRSLRAVVKAQPEHFRVTEDLGFELDGRGGGQPTDLHGRRRLLDREGTVEGQRQALGQCAHLLLELGVFSLDVGLCLLLLRLGLCIQRPRVDVWA